MILSGVHSSISISNESKNEKLSFIKRPGEDVNLQNKKAKQERKKRNIEFLYKTIFAMIIPLIPLVMRSVNDMDYYFASIVSLIFIVLSFYDLVKEHNLLVSNKLPQLEKRGGDENE